MPQFSSMAGGDYHGAKVALTGRKIGSAGRAKRPSLLFCYALGKAQRILAELAQLARRIVFLHGSIEPLVECYRQAGVDMLPNAADTPGLGNGKGAGVGRRINPGPAVGLRFTLGAPLRHGRSGRLASGVEMGQHSSIARSPRGDGVSLVAG